MSRRRSDYFDYKELGIKGRHTGLQISDNLKRDEYGMEDLDDYFSDEEELIPTNSPQKQSDSRPRTIATEIRTSAGVNKHGISTDDGKTARFPPQPSSGLLSQSRSSIHMPRNRILTIESDDDNEPNDTIPDERDPSADDDDNNNIRVNGHIDSEESVDETVNERYDEPSEPDEPDEPDGPIDEPVDEPMDEPLYEEEVEVDEPADEPLDTGEQRPLDASDDSISDPEFDGSEFGNPKTRPTFKGSTLSTKSVSSGMAYEPSASHSTNGGSSISTSKNITGSTTTKRKVGRPPKQTAKKRELTTEIPIPPTPEGPRRSKRTRIQPLQFWKNERVVYQLDHGRPSMKEIIRAQQTPEKKRARTHKPTAKKPKSSYSDKMRAQMDATDMPEKVEVEVHGYPDETTMEKRVVAWAPGKGVMRRAKNANYSLATLFERDAHFAAGGIMSIDPNSEKPMKPSKFNSYFFYLISGQVMVHLSQSKFKVTQGGAFEIPRGNFFGITNLSDTEPCELFFTQCTDSALNATTLKN
uniref:ARAD1C34958p n=1 Tax=Blastobotrys adeninivorans TaxID=409370 RepID=A0A060T937_BLAAD